MKWNIKAWIYSPPVFLLLVFARAPGANAPTQGSPRAHLHVAIEALADRQGVGPGQTFRVALVERIDPGWHTYWINPGDAGQATKLRWTLPAGYSIDAVQWPVPQVFRSGPLVTYGYEGETLLLQTVHAPIRLSSSTVQPCKVTAWPMETRRLKQLPLAM